MEGVAGEVGDQGREEGEREHELHVNFIISHHYIINLDAKSSQHHYVITKN